MANLFIEGLRAYMREGKFTVHDFVVMPNHIHILLTIPGDLSIEKAMQYIKGGFSFRAKKDLGFQGEVWQRGFSDVRIIDEHSFSHHRDYIESNPVRAGLANSAEEYPYASAFLMKQKCAGAKQAAEKLIALKGHDFSRATKSIESMRALAPEGCLPPVSPGIPSFPAASFAPAGGFLVHHEGQNCLFPQPG
jgi:putative transposase